MPLNLSTCLRFMRSQSWIGRSHTISATKCSPFALNPEPPTLENQTISGIWHWKLFDLRINLLVQEDVSEQHHYSFNLRNSNHCCLLSLVGKQRSLINSSFATNVWSEGQEATSDSWTDDPVILNTKTRVSLHRCRYKLLGLRFYSSSLSSTSRSTFPYQHTLASRSLRSTRISPKDTSHSDS